GRSERVKRSDPRKRRDGGSEHRGPLAKRGGLRSSSPPIEVVKREEGKEGVAPRAKERRRRWGEDMEREVSMESSALVTNRLKLVKKNAKEVATKTLQQQAVEPPRWRKVR
ncbi:hypothetical protein Dimus_003625, partial [Dionaea muscipula]